MDFPAHARARAAADAAGLAGLGDDLARAERAVVIAGSSIPGLVLAATLARGGARVALVTGPPPVPVRLVNGCSLRRGTLQILGGAFGDGAAGRIAARLGGAASSFAELRIARARAGAGGEVTFAAPERDVCWRSARMIGLSTRHGAILSALRAELPDLPTLTLVPAEVPRDALLAGDRLPLTTGTLRLPRGRAVILNATPFASLLRPGRALPAPERWVVAVQAPMRPTGGGARPIAGDVAIAPVLAPDGHLAFYTPFFDADTPAASWYGINTLVVPAPDPAATAAVRARLLAMGAALGLEPVGGDAARGEATVPVVGDPGALTQQRLDDGQPIVDVGRAFSSGAPAINVDGMLAGAAGATAFSAAFLDAPEPPPLAAARALDAADAALAAVRWRNRATEWFFFAAAPGFRHAVMALTSRPAAGVFVEDFANLAAT